jgi:chorismate mutase/prephenate dehydratase
VECASTDYGVVPIENSTEGAVTHTLDQFAGATVKICAEIYLNISHNLLAQGTQDEVEKIYSNPQVFGQCRNWLHENMPAVDLIPVSSTAKAAEMAAKDKTAGALASHLAAELYALNLLRADVQDSGGNATRFLVLAKEFGTATGTDKTSLLFTVRHKAGALHGALHAFSQFNINMSKIESRPSKGMAWEYMFFVDIEGHVEDENVSCAMENLSEHCSMVTVLGSYPAASKTP